MVWVHEAAGSNPVTPINATITLIGKGSVLKTLSNRDERCSCSSRDSGGNMAPWRNRQDASDLKSDSTNDWSVGSTPTGATTKQR